ncbi:ornithine cyclodeaminase family protein [Microbacterium paludicola]|uniref:Ornithine cyclodeaminase family protein n=2 Tax=Microbacterium paludicola TaxID=300019 RepID=A0A4Y9FSB1_9MICO|nr:ornithine cyclodeaminase family protein [Microbacterium paludicola]TFU32119.1 ornithine cyclodeaminase family protein [Microbacterium paludicola]
MIPQLSAQDIAALLPPEHAVAAIAEALRDGVDPAIDARRSALDLTRGQLLIMPSEVRSVIGVKLVTVGGQSLPPEVPRIQGTFVLFDARTLRPVSIMDGAALTAVRTAAVSLAAILPRLQTESGPLRVLAFGSGAQAAAHVHALTAALRRRRAITDIAYAVRTDRPAPATPGAAPRTVLIGTPEYESALGAADVVFCTTTSAAPLFGSAMVGDRAVIVAVGSHLPDERELDGALLGRSQVVVEDIGTALAEAGDVVMAVEEGHLAPDRLISMADAVRGVVRLDPSRPVVFKSTGMSWEDVVIGERIHRRWSARERQPAL